MSTAEELYDEALLEVSRENADIDKVVLMLRKSIAEGEPRAAYALGTWYLHGYGDKIGKDIDKALELLQQAASENVPGALFDLAVCYEKGEGLTKNLRTAMEYYLRAALNGDDQSVYEVGRGYHYGIGFEKDRKLSEIWFDRAEALGVYESGDD